MTTADGIVSAVVAMQDPATGKRVARGLPVVGWDECNGIVIVGGKAMLVSDFPNFLGYLSADELIAQYDEAALDYGQHRQQRLVAHLRSVGDDGRAQFFADADAVLVNQ